MLNHEIIGGKVQLYKRPRSPFWQCQASVGGKQRKFSTKQESLSLAKDVAEDWYLGLKGKSRAGELRSEKTFAQAAKQFLDEYVVITEGQRSKRWVEGHGIRLRVHLLPFFGELGLSEITPGKVQKYRGLRPRGLGPQTAERPTTIHKNLIQRFRLLKDHRDPRLRSSDLL